LPPRPPGAGRTREYVNDDARNFAAYQVSLSKLLDKVLPLMDDAHARELRAWAFSLAARSNSIIRGKAKPAKVQK